MSCKGRCFSFRIERGTENCRFLNTGMPYRIAQCIVCDARFVERLHPSVYVAKSMKGERNERR